MSGTTTSSATTASPSSPLGTALSEKGISVVALLTAIGTAVAIFAVQLGAFELLRNKFARI
jgi:ribosomal protein L11